METDSEIKDLLKDLIKLTASPILQKELLDDRTKSLFELTGELTAEQICKKLKMSKPTVLTMWKKWELLGIIKREGKGYKKIF